MYDVLQQPVSIGDYVWRSSTGAATAPMILGKLTRIELKRPQQSADYSKWVPGIREVPLHPTSMSGEISITVGGVAFRFDVTWNNPANPLEDAICNKILLATPEQLQRWSTLHV